MANGQVQGNEPETGTVLVQSAASGDKLPPVRVTEITVVLKNGVILKADTVWFRVNTRYNTMENRNEITGVDVEYPHEMPGVRWRTLEYVDWSAVQAVISL